MQRGGRQRWQLCLAELLLSGSVTAARLRCPSSEVPAVASVFCGTLCHTWYLTVLSPGNSLTAGSITETSSPVSFRRIFPISQGKFDFADCYHV